MYYVILNLIVIVILFIAVGRMLKNDIANFYREPIALATMAFVLISLIVPLFQFLVGYYRYQWSYPQSAHLAVLALNLLAIISFSVGYFLIDNRRRNIKKFQPTSNNVLIKVLLLLLPIALYFSISHLNTIFNVGVVAYLRDRISYGVGSGFALLMAHNLYVISLLLLAFLLTRVKLRRKKGLIPLLFVAITLFTIYYYYSIGSRNSLFLIVLVTFLITTFYIGRIPVRKSAYWLVAGLAFMIIFSYAGSYRTSKVVEGTVEFSMHEFTRGLNGAFGNNENLLWLVDNYGSYELSLGTTYAASVTNFVPRSIWPDKPVGGGPVLKNMIYPGSYIVGDKRNSSLTTGLQTEAFINFGIFGVLLVPAIFGAILGYIRNGFYKVDNEIKLTIHAILVITFSFSVFYSEALGMLARIIFTTIPLYAASLFLAKPRQ